jgi:hypothetical protein
MPNLGVIKAGAKTMNVAKVEIMTAEVKTNAATKTINAARATVVTNAKAIRAKNAVDPRVNAVTTKTMDAIAKDARMTEMNVVRVNAVNVRNAAKARMTNVRTKNNVIRKNLVNVKRNVAKTTGAKVRAVNAVAARAKKRRRNANLRKP